MNLTGEQFTAVINYILADPVLGALDRHNSELAFNTIAPALNTEYSPAFWVWTDCMVQEIIENGFIWTDVDTLTVGKARIWEWMSASNKGIDGRKANVRQGLKDAFGNGSALYNAVISHLKRKVSVAEKIFATGTGTEVNPGKSVVDGPIQANDFLFWHGDIPGWWIRPEE